MLKTATDTAANKTKKVVLFHCSMTYLGSSNEREIPRIDRKLLEKNTKK